MLVRQAGRLPPLRPHPPGPRHSSEEPRIAVLLGRHDPSRWAWLHYFSPATPTSHPQMDLCLRTHHLGRPGWLMGERNLDEFDPRHTARGIADTLPQIICRGASRSRSGHCDVNSAGLFVGNVVDEAEINDVVAQFRVDHQPKRVLDARDYTGLILSGGSAVVLLCRHALPHDR